MKLNEITGQKLGLIVVVHDDTIDAGDWQGSTEVFLNEKAFQKRVLDLFAEFTGDPDVADTPYDKIDDVDGWDDFIDGVWIDDRF